MWAEGSTIKSVKESQGKALANREDVHEVLWNALNNSTPKVLSVFSFAVSLLPFFSATPNLIDANYNNIEQYVKCVSTDSPLKAMASFLQLPKIGFRVDPAFRRTFESMAKEFQTGSARIRTKNDKGLNNIIKALHDWAPSMSPNSVFGLESTQLVQKLTDVITVCFAMACWPDMKVPNISTHLIAGRVQCIGRRHQAKRYI